MTQSDNNILPLEFHRVLTRHAGTIGLLIRMVVAYILPSALDDAVWISGVAYTDIDYHVFLDAAQHLKEGRSPYDRHTYRYTPFLALLLSKLPNMKFTARYLFCGADALCGILVMRLRQTQRQRRQQQHDQDNYELSDAFWWLYNPFAINICTRGSAESLVLLPVLITIYLLIRIKNDQDKVALRTTKASSDDHRSSSVSSATLTSSMALWSWVCLAGVCHGLAVHAKLYPIIYTLSYVAYLAPPSEKTMHKAAEVRVPNPKANSLSARVMLGWVQRLLTPLPILFGISSLLTFGALTYLAYVQYGPVSLQEGLLYHLGRVDHRHNYSMFWYPIYLGRAAAEAAASSTASDSNALHSYLSNPASFLRVASRLLFVPQALLLVYTSLGLAPKRLALALFVQTFSFVALNKVITAQYFTWYLVLLPLCSSEFQHGWSHKSTRRRLKLSIAAFVASIVIWLGSAYLLEMQGCAVHRHVFVASVLLFAASVNLLGALLGSAAAGQAFGESCVPTDVTAVPLQNKIPSKVD